MKNKLKTFSEFLSESFSFTKNDDRSKIKEILIELKRLRDKKTHAWSQITDHEEFNKIEIHIDDSINELIGLIISSKWTDNRLMDKLDELVSESDSSWNEEEWDELIKKIQKLK